MDSSGSCPRFFNSCGDSIQSVLDSPMPWIGMYVAAASAIISLAMAIDTFSGFKSKKLWLPSKYFSVNAFSLTLLAVAMKLPLDLTNQMLGVNEILARVSSLVLMSTAMGNLLLSFGTLEKNEIVLNLAALGTLVITIVVNVCIHISQMLYTVEKEFRNTAALQIYAEQIIAIVFMLILFVQLYCCGVAALRHRNIVELWYHNMYGVTSTEQVRWGNFTIDGLREVVRKYWVKVQSGNLQLIIARSETCATSSVMCVLIALILLEAWIRMHFGYKGGVVVAASNYKWSINWILFIQTIGVGLGTVAPVFRWFLAAKFKSSNIGYKSVKEELKIELYWTKILVDWRDSPLPLNIRHPKVRKFVNDAKKLVLNLCIVVQVVIVLASKLLLLISAACVKIILLCFKQKKSSDPVEEDIASCILLHQNTEYAVKKICNEADKLIRIGKKKQPMNLIKLLEKSVGFNGVREFDSKGVPRLHSQEPPNFWSLPIVTLTSIAIALPNITTDKVDQLLRGVTEGLYFVKLIEKSLNRDEKLERYRNALDVVWREFEQYQEWQGIKLNKITLQQLSDTAKRIVEDLKIKVEISKSSNPLQWPLEVIAANSMYRISQTIIQSNKDNDSEKTEDLFDRLSIMISDILSACLTNLVPLITFKCRRTSAMKEMQKSVHEAAILLGQTEVILEMIQQRKLPRLDPDEAAYIERWRDFMESDEEQVIEVED